MTVIPIDKRSMLMIHLIPNADRSLTPAALLLLLAATATISEVHSVR